jgi:signal transduction histidine kinase
MNQHWSPTDPVTALIPARESRMELVFDYTTNAAAGPSRELERMARYIAGFQAYIGHELPNQLVVMQGFSRELLEHHADTLDQEGREMLEHLAALAQRADAHARRLAEIGRLLRDPPWGLPLSADEIVREAIAEVNALGAPAGISYDVQQSLPTVYASRRLLHQVLVQLLRNAVGAITIGAGGGATSPRSSGGTIAIGGKCEPAGVSLWVSDTGRGMTESQAGLFEPFAAGRLTDSQGVGMGLFLVCQAVARWGGILRVQSQVGQGSSFCVYLPDAQESGVRDQEAGIRNQESGVSEEATSDSGPQIPDP